jgi:hypothetical protein
MENLLFILGKISLFIHIAAGITTLIAGPIAIYANLKNKKLHRTAGMAFFFAMNVVCISAVLGYFKHRDQLFFVFLLGVAIFVYGSILRGVRAIKLMKGGQVIKFDFVYTTLLGLGGLWMVGMSIWHYTKDGGTALVILFAVFSLALLKDTYDNFIYFLSPHNYTSVQWLKLHVGSMLGAFTASTTAFTVTTAHFLPWYAQWFGPFLLLLPLQIYWSRRFETQYQQEMIVA